MSYKIKNIITMFLGTSINMVLGAITVPIITHIINPTEYGMFSMLQTYISIFVTICLLGLEQAYVRFFYSEDGYDYKNYLSKKVICLPTLLSLIISFVAITLGRKNWNFNTLSSFLFCFCIFITVFDTFTRLSVRLEQNAKLYSVLLIFHRLVYAGIIVILIERFKVYEVDALLLGTGCSLFATVVIAVLCNKKIWLKKTKYVSNGVNFKSLIKYSYPFIFSSVAGWIFNAADKLALQYFSTYEEIGYYAAAANIVALITMIQTSFSMIWVPMAVENFEKNPENKLFYSKSLDYMAIIMFFLGSTVVLFKDVLAFILGGNYEWAKYVFPCLVFHPIMFTLSETTVYGINFYRKTQWHIVITVSSCTVNVMGNIFLVPFLGGKGAAISTGLSYIFFFIMRTVIAQKYYKVNYHIIRICLLIFLSVAFFLYSSFFATSFVTILLYGICISMELLLYRKELNELIKMLSLYFMNRG